MTPHAQYINELIQKHKLKVGAEIGVRDGVFSEYLLSQNPDLKMYAVDVWQSVPGMSISDSNRDHQANLTETMTRFKPYRERVTILKSISTTAARYVSSKSLDFVFIDAGHDFKSVVDDLRAWYPKVKSKGWLTGHDYHPGRGVKKAVDTYCRNVQFGGYEYESNDKNITWICRKADVDEKSLYNHKGD